MLGDWHTYQLNDFIGYSEESYLFLLKDYNEWIFPFQFIAVFASSLCVWVLLKQKESCSWCPRAFFALSFFVVAYCFFFRFLSALSPSAWVFGGYFLLLGALYVFALFFPGLLQSCEDSAWQRKIGLLFFVIAAWVPVSYFLSGELLSVTLAGWGDSATIWASAGFLLACQKGAFRTMLLLLHALWLLSYLPALSN